MVPDFSMFFLFFFAIVLARTEPTQQKIAKVINYHLNQSKVPVSYFNPVKISFY